MADEQDLCDNFEEVQDRQEGIIHDIFFDSVQNLLQLENSQQS
jgi:hypothetical protein